MATYLTRAEKKAIGDTTEYLRTQNRFYKLDKMAKQLDAQGVKALVPSPGPTEHISRLRDIADKAERSARRLQNHVSDVRSVADDLETTIQGSEQLYAGIKPDEGQQEGKSLRKTRTTTYGKYKSVYELAQYLPSHAQKAFMDEYNQTPYGQEGQLMQRYIERYGL